MSFDAPALDEDLTNDCLRDCNATWGGTAFIDTCGACVGGTTGLTPCTIATLEPVADAEVSSFSSGTNLGTASSLTIEPRSNEIFLRFDLSSIPPGAVILNVSLQMLAYTGYAYGGDGNVYTYFVADDSWGETTITWNNKPASANSPVGYWWLWYDGSYIDHVGLNADPALIPLVQAESDGDRSVSFRLASPGYRTLYRSREHGTSSARPKLAVEYSIPVPVPVAPPAPTG